MSGVPAARLLAIVLPVVCIGLFARVLYTPDEPREASLVVSMAAQADKSLPALGGVPFAEKPPLLYWLGAASTALAGPSPAALRVPNLLYALAAALAIAALAARAAGPGAGFASGVVAVTALQSYQVLIWLATDAPLLAGVALALFGAHGGLTADERRGRLRGYLVMHLGLLVAFFAKGPAGWLVPGSAFLVAVVAERRPRELLRSELWAGAPLLAAAIGGWVLWVASSPGGPESLRVLFFYNLIGRAVAIGAPGGLDYASGHQNSFAKYLLELPMYLLPWTALAVAALRRVPRGWRAAGPAGTAWRLALGAIVPPTLLLSLAATARGVYYAPLLLGFALVVGLYSADAATALDRFERACWRVTGIAVALLAVLLAAAAVLLCAAPALRTPSSIALGIVALAAGGWATWLALVPLPSASGAWPRLALAVALVLSLAVAPAYVELNRVLSLEALSSRIQAAASGPWVVVGPDETTLAMLELYFPKSPAPTVLRPEAPGFACELGRALQAAGPQAHVLVGVRDPMRWDRRGWLAYLGYIAGPAAAPPASPALGEFALVAQLTRPGGRAFQVLAPEPGASAAACR